MVGGTVSGGSVVGGTVVGGNVVTGTVVGSAVVDCTIVAGKEIVVVGCAVVVGICTAVQPQSSNAAAKSTVYIRFFIPALTFVVVFSRSIAHIHEKGKDALLLRPNGV